MKAGLTIGELARDLHLNPKTIRYYEEIGLLPELQRSESGYRLYSRGEAERLRLVKKAKLLGLSLAEIKELVQYAIDGHCNALEHRLLSLIKVKLGEIDQKMRDLTAFREDLRRYQRDLTARLASVARKERRQETPCRCIVDQGDV
ncbi:MAG: MerR family transcriptional regulator [Chloroflexota bacterium]